MWGYQSDGNGLMRLGHRYYDASIGRFLSRDPIHEGYNGYTYCDNDPINCVDPEGLQGDDGKGGKDKDKEGKPPKHPKISFTLLGYRDWELSLDVYDGRGSKNNGTAVAGDSLSYPIWTEKDFSVKFKTMFTRPDEWGVGIVLVSK